MNSTEKIVEQIKERDLASFREYTSEQNEKYAQEARNAGYDNTHEYEAAILRKTSNRLLLIAVLLILIAIAAYFII